MYDDWNHKHWTVVDNFQDNTGGSNCFCCTQVNRLYATEVPTSGDNRNEVEKTRESADIAHSLVMLVEEFYRIVAIPHLATTQLAQGERERRSQTDIDEKAVTRYLHAKKGRSEPPR